MRALPMLMTLLTGHLFYVTAVNPAGASAPGLGLAVKTPAGAAPGEFNN